jgi:hypothetical protein
MNEPMENLLVNSSVMASTALGGNFKYQPRFISNTPPLMCHQKALDMIARDQLHIICDVCLSVLWFEVTNYFAICFHYHGCMI